MDTRPEFELRLLGTLELFSSDGENLTPRLEKSKGLLAYLAVAEGRAVARTVLQALLWSDRGEIQARESLKKGLKDLRRSFGTRAGDVLIAQNGTLRLDLSRLRVDLFAEAFSQQSLYTPVFLDGINIRDECFEEWLRMTRARLSDRPKVPAVTAPTAAAEEPPRPNLHRIGIGFLETTPPSCKVAGALAFRLRQALQQKFTQSGFFDVHDYAIGQSDIGGTPRVSDLMFRVDCQQIGHEFSLAPNLFDVAGRRLLWSDALSFDGRTVTLDDAQIYANQVFDQLCERIFKCGALQSDAHLAARHAFVAIDHIFRLSRTDLTAAERALNQAIDCVEGATFYAWQAFLSAFQVEKMGRVNSPDILEKAHFYVKRALELDRHNPLVVALVAHIQSFVLREREQAVELLRGWDKRGPTNPMLSDTLAMLNFYEGRFAQAEIHARQACRLGANNPFRYSFTTSLAMSQLMQKDYARAARTSQRALAQHPFATGHRYEPTLRTLAAACSFSDRKAEGRSALETLNAQSGQDTLAVLQSGSDTPFPNTDVLTVVRSGLEGLYA